MHDENIAVAAPALDHDPDVLITRLFDAPRERVFAAWTDPAQLQSWYAPAGCSIAFSAIDVRPGGAFHSVIRTPTGKDCWCKGVYLEVVVPERIVQTMVISDAAGDDFRPQAAGMSPDWPPETVVTVTFADRGGKTLVTLHQTVSESIAKRTGAHPGWLSMLDRLADALMVARAARQQ